MATTQAPGWFPDPAGGTMLRWWDGYQWTSQLTETPRKRSNRRAWMILGIAGAALSVILVISAAVSDNEKGPGGPGFHVAEDTGTGIGFATKVDTGWDCYYSSIAFACRGGSGNARSVGSSHRAQLDIAGQIDTATDELVIVFDPVRWRCALMKVGGGIGCDLR